MMEVVTRECRKKLVLKLNVVWNLYQNQFDLLGEQFSCRLDNDMEIYY